MHIIDPKYHQAAQRNKQKFTQLVQQFELVALHCRLFPPCSNMAPMPVGPILHWCEDSRLVGRLLHPNSSPISSSILGYLAHIIIHWFGPSPNGSLDQDPSRLSFSTATAFDRIWSSTPSAGKGFVGRPDNFCSPPMRLILPIFIKLKAHWLTFARHGFLNKHPHQSHAIHLHPLLPACGRPENIFVHWLIARPLPFSLPGNTLLCFEDTTSKFANSADTTSAGSWKTSSRKVLIWHCVIRHTIGTARIESCVPSNALRRFRCMMNMDNHSTPP